MAFDVHENFAYTTVATAPSPATSGTSLVVAAGGGALYPATPFNVVIWQAGANPTTTNSEIARVTNVSTDTLTITRGAPSGGGLNGEVNNQNRSIVVGDQVALANTSKVLVDIEKYLTGNTGGPTLLDPVINNSISGTAIDTDGTLAGNLDTKVASQKAVKTYVDSSNQTAINVKAYGAVGNYDPSQATSAGVNVANLAANNTAFAAAWAAAKAAGRLLYIPVGDYGIGPNILKTDNADAGILGENIANTTLWFIDTTNTGTCVKQSMTSPSYWEVPVNNAGNPMGLQNLPPISEFTIDGSFAGTGSVGMRVGPAICGYWNVRVRNFTGTGGANGVTGLTGAIGILMQNDKEPQGSTTLNGAINSAVTTITVASASGWPTSGNYTILIDTEQMLVTAGQGTTSWTVTRGYNSTSAASHLNAAAVTGRSFFTEENTFGPATALNNCTHGLVIDKGNGGSSFGYNSFQHVYLQLNSSTGVDVVNGAWLYGVDFFFKGNNAGTSTLFNITGSSRVTGNINVNFEMNGGTCTTFNIDSTSQWNTQGAIDTHPFATAGAQTTSITGAFHNTGVTMITPLPTGADDWNIVYPFAGATMTSGTTFTLADDWTNRFVKGTRVRWAESGVLKYGILSIDSTFAGSSTTVTLNAASDTMGANADNGSLAWSHIRPPDYTLKGYEKLLLLDGTPSIIDNGQFVTMRMLGTGSNSPVFNIDNATAANSGVVQSGNGVGSINFRGSHDTTPAMVAAGNIAVVATQNFSDATHAGSQMRFKVTPNNSGTGAQALLIDQDATVAIGTNSTGTSNPAFILATGDATFNTVTSSNWLGTTAAFTKVNNTLATVTNLSATSLLTGTVYRVTATLFFTSTVAATCGFKIQLTATGSLTTSTGSMRYTLYDWTAGTLVSSGAATMGSPFISGTSFTNSDVYKAEIVGVITTSHAGGIDVQFAQNTTNATTATLSSGSIFSVDGI